MSQRMRRNNRSERMIRESEGENREGHNLSELRHEGESFLIAAEEAINKALSGDSQAFLSQSRQEGGQ